MKCSIIVVDHDKHDMTRDCLESIECTDYPHEIILVDNGSEVPCPGLATKQVYTTENLTVGAACRQANELLDPESDYVALLNNDIVVVQPEWLCELVRIMKSDSKIAAAAPLQIRLDGSVYCTAVYFDHERSPNHLYMNHPMSHPAIGIERRNALALNHGAIVIRRDVWEHFGYDPRFDMFGHYQDTDWCLRVRKDGYRLTYTPNAYVIHLGGATMLEHLDYANESLQKNLERFKEKWRGEDSRLFEEGNGSWLS